MEFAGPAQGDEEAINIPGILDTGADRTVLPFDYAEQLGYDADELTLSHAQQVQGSAEVYVPHRPSRAWVPGAEWYRLAVVPIFIGGALNALWGVQDVMSGFPITFESAERRYTLHFPDPPQDLLDEINTQP